MVGFRIRLELHGFDGVPPLDEGFADPMHSIHHRAIGGANDRIPQLCLLHEATVRGKRPPRRRFVRSKEWVVELLNLVQWDRTDSELPRQLDEAIDIPGKQAARRRAKVVLLTHQARDGWRTLGARAGLRTTSGLASRSSLGSGAAGAASAASCQRSPVSCSDMLEDDELYSYSDVEAARWLVLRFLDRRCPTRA